MLVVLVVALLGIAGVSVRLVLVTRERDSLRDELRNARTHDPLTKLPNRQLFLAALSEELTTASTGALLILDVDGLPAVNDSHGHEAGDAVLVEVARRIREVVRADDDVARLSGGEFVVLLRTDPGADVVSIADRVLERARVTEPVTVAMRVGLVAWDADTQPESAADLLRAAERAMSTRPTAAAAASSPSARPHALPQLRS